jgi:hypothetical protein
MALMTNNKQQTAVEKLLLATLLIGMISGCTEPTVKSTKTNYTVPTAGGVSSNPLEICVIDGCEYFKCEVHGGVVVSHKGNCSNPIHKGGNK